MEEEPTTIDTLFARVKDFSVAYAEMLKLKALDFAAEIISSVVPDLLFAGLIVAALLFINLGIAFWLGGILGKTYLGFLIVGCFYLVILVILRLVMRSWLKSKIGNYFIKNIFRHTEL
jgi:hypothetical protein